MLEEQMESERKLEEKVLDVASPGEALGSNYLQQQFSPGFGSKNTESPLPASSGDPFTIPRLNLQPQGAKPSVTSAHLQKDQAHSIDSKGTGLSGDKTFLDMKQLGSWDQLKDKIAGGRGRVPDAGELITPISPGDSVSGKGVHTPRGSDASSFCSQNRKKLAAPRSRSVSPIASMKDDRSEIASIWDDRPESAEIPNRSVSPISRRASQTTSGSQMIPTIKKLSKSLLPQDDVAGSEQGSILHVASPRDGKFTPRSHVSSLTPRDMPTPRSRVSGLTTRNMPSPRSHVSALGPSDGNMISPRSHVSALPPRDVKLPAPRSHLSALRPVESDMPTERSRSVSPIGSCQDDKASSVAGITRASNISSLWSSSTPAVRPVSSGTTQLVPKLAMPASLKRQEDRVGSATGSNRSVSPLTRQRPRQPSAR